MKYLEDPRLTKLTADLSGVCLNTRGSGASGTSSVPLMVRPQPAGGRRGGRGGAAGRTGRQPGGNKPRTNGANSSGRGSGRAGYRPDGSVPALYSYNPAGYSSTFPSSSCRVVHGRVEAYNTKRAGSDKRTAHEVNERYGTEMERLNRAVEEMKRRHAEAGRARASQEDAEEGARRDDDGAGAGGEKDEEEDEEGISARKRRQQLQRARSRSVDCVTFGSPSTARFDGRDAPSLALGTLEEKESFHGEERDGGETPADADAGGRTPNGAKRHLEGILKHPSTTNKRCRSTSFDVSTGPSSPFGRRWRPLERSQGAAAGRALIPQPSLYQSSVIGSSSGPDSSSPLSPHGGLPPSMMAPRRLVTDLILTLNASFPDYDFSTATVGDFSTLSVPQAIRAVNANLGEYAATTDAGADFLPRLWNTLDDVFDGGLQDAGCYTYAPAGGGGDDPLEFLTVSMASDPVGGGPDYRPDGRGLGSGTDRVVSDEQSSSADAARVPYDAPGTRAADYPLPSSSSHGHVTLWSMNYFFVSKNKKRIVLFACVETMRTPRGGDPYDPYEDGFVYDDCDGGYGENDVVFDEARRSADDCDDDGGGGGRADGGRAMSSMGREERGAVTVEEDEDAYDVCVEMGEDDEHHEGDGADFDTGNLSAPSQQVA